MKHTIFVTLGLLAAMAFPRLALAQPEHIANSPKADMNLSAPLVVGSQTLQAGQYKIQCKKIDGQEFLVVTSSEDGREVTRVPCRPEALKAKIAMSDIRTVPGPNGSQLYAVRIKGESIAHLVVSN